MPELPELYDARGNLIVHPASPLRVEIIEASRQTEEMLALEDQGWLRLGQQVAPGGQTDAERKESVAQARVYGARDPLGVQSIRLWTTYAFGTGMTFDVPDKAAKKVVDKFWLAPENRGVLSSAGQRKSSDRVLTDGEIFFAVFVDAQKNARIRRIDPLEITAFITDPDDAEDVKFYQRTWTNAQGKQGVAYYRSAMNQTNEPAKGSDGSEVRSTGDAEDAVVFHLAINSIGQRGNSLLLPALLWIFLHRRFLASRAAIMLALSRFAWKGKVKGGQAAVDTLRNALHDDSPKAASVFVENEGVDLTPYSPNSQAGNANQDARMLKLQVISAVGFPEPYFGDISIGNWATAKTVALPVQKQIQVYQDLWTGTFNEIDQYVMAQNGIPVDAMYIDRDFPAISPEDAGLLANNIQKMAAVFPGFADLRDMKQQGLLVSGVDDVQVALDELEGTGDATTESGADPRQLARLIRLAEVIARGVQPDDSRNGHSHEEDDVRVVRGNGTQGV